MSSDFWIITTAILMSASCGLLGCFLILRKMALIGDAISHAVLPGIAIAFLFSGGRDSLAMMIGATALGLLAVFLIQWLQSSGVQSDASIGIIFTALFAIGVIVVSLNARNIDLDLDCVLFGEIAYVQWDTWAFNGIDMGPRSVWMLGFTLLVVVTLLTLCYKQFKLTAFDPALAAACGIPVLLFHYLLMGMVSMTSVASFESVGAILVVGMLVIPAATAYLLTDRLHMMLLSSVAVGVASSILGYAAAYILNASIGGSIVTTAGVLFIITFLLSPRHGILLRKWRQTRAIPAK